MRSFSLTLLMGAEPHFTTLPISSSGFCHKLRRSALSSLISLSKSKGQKNKLVKCEQLTSKGGNWQESRRLVSISLVLLHCFSLPHHAIAGSVFDRYVKRKKLEPLESYVPAVILTEFQIKDLEKNLEVEQPQYATCRTLLRSGAAASLRANIRAVAQYASDDGKGIVAFNNVDQCISLLQTVPSDVLDKGKAIADSYRTLEDVEPQELDQELKQLESIL